MSGDTSTCGVHLDGIAQLISHMRNFKLEYSRKARALHRIYCYVRLIYESTAPWPTSPGLQIQRTLHLQSMDLTPKSPFISPVEEQKKRAAERDSPDLCSYECIYGIPQPLLAFMKRSVLIVDQVCEARRESGTTLIPDSIAAEAEQLECELLGWNIDDCLAAAGPEGEEEDVNTAIVRRQTLAFHNALIIYLSQHVRLLNHHYIQPYIQGVIQNIEEIEEIKTREGILAAPLYWPVFIAASEAYDKRFQERFRKWYGQTERYGIEAVRTGVQVIHQVWEQGPVVNRTVCAWRTITQKMGVTLILT
jgi:arginine metabolism regulation protein II